MSKKTKLTILGLAALLQLCVLGFMIYSHEIVLLKGDQYKMKTQPVDPYDPIRGRYISLSVQHDIYLSPTDVYKVGETVYAILNQDDKKFTSISHIQRTVPKHKHYIKTTVNFAYKTTKNEYSTTKANDEVFWVALDLPFERFYVEEHLAPEIENLYERHSQRNMQNAHITFRVLNGKAVLENLYIQNLPVSEFIKHSDRGKK